MPKKKIPNSIKILLLISVAAIVTFFILRQEDKTELNQTGEATEASIMEDVEGAANIFKYNNILFSLPSPYQISLLLEQSGIPYNKDILHTTRKASDYVDNFSKAVNFGIYGADLGYINIYGQTQDAASYFAVLKIISQDIGLYNAMDKPTIQRIEANIENRDSLLLIVSNTYRKIDNYLKSNDRENTGALILAGGWVESIYILTQQIQANTSNDLMARISEQKRPLENLIKLLVPYSNESKDFYFLVDRLIDLAYTFDEIESKYTYIPPVTNSKQKLTVVKSKSELVMNKKQLDAITEKVSIIRQHIIK
ncbi:hypothetical protein L3049_15885 [Labilibaculum sp. DW002]|jgi:hypothetical protein|uniref:Uncharacterized protein n=1 Tax=Paralabilibaculum antarcticum TaxID=2912572 RepID=A0ABT5VYW4_9BACT|nr:hypothetical protein [Labilibaculum sp. DW002]MDE5419474.1 hypothetical protein [Labilibaculum sp. DW002]